MLVYVLNKDSKPLMPCKPQKDAVYYWKEM